MRILILLTLTAALSFLTSCGEGESKETAKTKTPKSYAKVDVWPATKTTDQGNFEVTVQPGGGEILNNKHFSLRVSLAAKKGDLQDVKVAVDADMPAHQHGMNTKPVLTSQDPATHEVEGMLFHMAGNWVITVDVERGGQKEKASFPVSVE